MVRSRPPFLQFAKEWKKENTEMVLEGFHLSQEICIDLLSSGALVQIGHCSATVKEFIIENLWAMPLSSSATADNI